QRLRGADVACYYVTEVSGWAGRLVGERRGLVDEQRIAAQRRQIRVAGGCGPREDVAADRDLVVADTERRIVMKLAGRIDVRAAIPVAVGARSRVETPENLDRRVVSEEVVVGRRVEGDVGRKEPTGL